MRLQIWQDWSQHDYSTNILQYITAHIEEWESAHNSYRQYEVKTKWVPYRTHYIGSRTLNVKKQPTFHMQKHSMWKPENHNQTFF